MREIKFRAWNYDTEEMLKWEDIRGWSMSTLNMNERVYYEIPMQFTGLKDKNGVEIYEGDIIKGNYLKDIGVVKWNDKFAKFNISDKMNISPSDEFEVIGNIYENKELLGE